MKRVYLAQVNNAYGENQYMPYSVGLIWAYARTIPGVLDSWALGGFQYRKEPIEAAVAKLVDPDLVAISCYIWNWRWSLAYAAEVKRVWPGCKILVGGVQVQDESDVSIRENEQIDFAIYGEGEGAFAQFLVELAKETPDLNSVGSLIWRNGSSICVNRRGGFADIASLRSPYLDGVFDSILDDGPKWQGLQETNRGCPYSCTWCAWGASAMDKVRPLDERRILDEIKWFSDHRCTYVENCDANFGILPRDKKFVDELVRLKKETGYPQRFRAAWLKNSNERVFELASELHSVDMLKAVTLSVQSMNEEVLTLTKRKNIKYDSLAKLIRRYNDAGIPTYSELIMGQPGETSKSFVQGIDMLLDAGQHDGLFVYPCMLLPNTEMNLPAYKELHGIKSVETQAMLLHGVPDPSVIQEIQELVVETSSMTHSEWKHGYIYSWLIQGMHVCGLTQEMAIQARWMDVEYSTFYTLLLSWAGLHSDTVLGRELKRFCALLDGGLSGDPWTMVDTRLGEVSWPPEEFLYLQCVMDLDRFFGDLVLFVRSIRHDKSINDSVATGLLSNMDLYKSHIVRPEPGNEAEWARENVWYGRKGSGAKKRMKK